MKAYCIALKENSLSWRLGQECVNAAESFGLKAKIFQGVLGFNANFQQFGIKNLLNLKIQERVGAQGCFLSHFILWQRCLELGAPIMILEHDGLMVRPIPNLLLSLPFDICYLDPYNKFGKGYEEELKASSRRNVEIVKASEAINFGLYGYVIKPSGAQKAIDFALNNGAYSAETHIKITPNMRKLMTTETVVRLHQHYTSGKMEEDSLTKNLRIDDAI